MTGTVEAALKALEARIEEYEDHYDFETEHVHAEFRKETVLTGNLTRRTVTEDWDGDASVAYSHRVPEEKKVFVCLLRRYTAANTEEEVTLATAEDLTQCLLAAAERLAQGEALEWKDPAVVRQEKSDTRSRLFMQGMMQD